jgi:hypothetical protein
VVEDGRIVRREVNYGVAGMLAGEIVMLVQMVRVMDTGECCQS